jgi:hypothetical protein
VSTLQIDLDKETSDALTSLAAARGTAPTDLVAEIVAQCVGIHEPPAHELHESTTHRGTDVGRKLAGISIKEAAAIIARHPREPGLAPPDPIDGLAGSVDIDPVDDIDEVIYER